MISRLRRGAILIATLTVAAVWGLMLPAAAETQETADDATVRGPDQVVVGQGITISGAGWVAAPGVGSVVAVKLDDGDIERKTPVADPATQGPLAADIFAVVQAGADGAFTATVEFPSTANATDTWAAGSKGSLRLLTGSLLAGDQTRTVKVPFEVVASTTPAPSPTIVSAEPSSPTTPAESAPTPDISEPDTSKPETEQPAEVRLLPQADPTSPTKVTAAASCSDKTTVKLTGESSSGGKPAAPLGGSLRLVGAGFCVEDGTSGSTIAIKIDDGKYNPVSSKAPRGGWQVINVGSNGSFDVVVKVPTANETVPAFTAGAHSLRLLTGSLKTGDVQRSIEVAFVATGSSSSSSPSATTPASSTDTSNTSNNSSDTSATNSTSGNLAATGGSRPAVLVIGLLLIMAGIAVLRRDSAHDGLGRNDP